MTNEKHKELCMAMAEAILRTHYTDVSLVLHQFNGTEGRMKYVARNTHTQTNEFIVFIIRNDQPLEISSQWFVKVKE